MIAFMGGMRTFIGRVTRDFLIAHRLDLTQCAPNMFRTMLIGYITVSTLRARVLPQN